MIELKGNILTFTGEHAEMVRRLAEKWYTTTSEAMHRIVRESINLGEKLEEEKKPKPKKVKKARKKRATRR